VFAAITLDMEQALDNIAQNRDGAIPLLSQFMTSCKISITAKLSACHKINS